MLRMRSLFPLAAVVALLAPATASADFPHVVLPGESLTSVAAADGLSIAQLAAANGLSPDAQLVAGTTLMIPPQLAGAITSTPLTSSPATSSPATSSAGETTAHCDGDSDSDDVGCAPPRPRSACDGDGDGDDGGCPAPAGSGVAAPLSSAADYIVQPGDTLSAIAARAGTSVSALAAANGLDPNRFLLSGSVLRVAGLPQGSSGTTASTASAMSQPVGSAAQGSPSSPPYPTPERVTASQIGSIASANGVPASLADAIAWQESGFNNDLVSSADARGVMQILPGTWDWIQRSLTAGTPLAPASALDNVRGGVLLLHSLLNSTGGNSATAAAGYYQGLPSVQRNGLFSDTQNYVNSVLALQRRFGGG